MTIKHIGIITNGQFSQATVNHDHANDIGNALTNLGYTVSYYDLAKTTETLKLINDRHTGKLDLIFNNAAGKRGGDGSVEGFLETLDIPYVGSDVLATAVAFDKKTTKSVVADHGVPIIRGLDFHREDLELRQDWVVKHIEEFLKYPIVVKASQGSDSIGVSLVRKPEQLIPALEKAFKEDSQVIVEDFIKRLAEVTCMVIGNGEHAYALKPVERVYEGDILYARDVVDRTYRIPEHISEKILKQIEEYSVVAHNALNCSDYSRSDFLINKKGQIYFLELNAHAGLGKVGPTVYAGNATHNWTHQELIGEIVNQAASRY